MLSRLMVLCFGLFIRRGLPFTHSIVRRFAVAKAEANSIASDSLVVRQRLPLLVHFRDVHHSLRLEEFRAVASTLYGENIGTGIAFTDPLISSSQGEVARRLYSFAVSPPEPVLLLVNGLNAVQAATVADRCVLVRGVYEVFGAGLTHREAAARSLEACAVILSAPPSPPSSLAPSLASPPLASEANNRAEEDASELLLSMSPGGGSSSGGGDGGTESWCCRIRRQGVGRAKLKPSEVVQAKGAELKAVIDVFSRTLEVMGLARFPVKLRGATHKLFVVEDRTPPPIDDQLTDDQSAAAHTPTSAHSPTTEARDRTNEQGGGALKRVYFGKELHAWHFNKQKLQLQPQLHGGGTSSTSTSQGAGQVKDGRVGGKDLRDTADHSAPDDCHHHLLPNSHNHKEALAESSPGVTPNPTKTKKKKNTQREKERELEASRQRGQAPGQQSRSASSEMRSDSFTQRVVARFSVKSRRYIGPTTLDAEMSFLLCNLAGVKQGSAVLDPFCGTGGVLLAAAELGADPNTSFGCDIDPVVLAGRVSARPGDASTFKGDRKRLRWLVDKGKLSVAGASSKELERMSAVWSEQQQETGGDDAEEDTQREAAKMSIESNFEDQGLAAPTFVCADAATLPKALLPHLNKNKNNKSTGLGGGVGGAWKSGAKLFDAIVTDPPYGKRELLGSPTATAATTLTHTQKEEEVDEEEDEEEERSLGQHITVLLDLADRCLVPGGTLAFFLPIHASMLLSPSTPNPLPVPAGTEGREKEEEEGEEGEEGEVSAESVLALLPSHPNFKVASVGREVLGNQLHRLLVVMTHKALELVEEDEQHQQQREKGPWHDDDDDDDDVRALPQSFLAVQEDCGGGAQAIDGKHICDNGIQAIQGKSSKNSIPIQRRDGNQKEEGPRVAKPWYWQGNSPS